MTENNQQPKVILYQWPSNLYTDSIYVRCTKIQRLMGLLKIPYEVAEVSFPIGTSQSNRVQPLMREIPILKTGEAYVKDSATIINYLIEKSNFSGFVIPNPNSRAMSYFLNHWVTHWFEWLIIYARWVVEPNYIRFINSFPKTFNVNKFRKGLDFTRNKACGIIKATEIGILSHIDYLQKLDQGLNSLNGMLNSQDFLLGNTIQECDLGFFMCIQALADPSLLPECTRVNSYPNIIRWALKVEQLTQTKHTIKISFQEGSLPL